MPGISRNNDTSGGDLIPSRATVFANGELVIVDNDGVAGHGVPPHIPQNIIAGSNNVFIGGIAVCNAGDGNTVCGHTATGSSDVIVGDAADAVAIVLGVTNFSRPEVEALDILAGRVVEEANGVDPDQNEGTEYGDGGIATVVGGSANRYANVSPVNNVSGPIDANSAVTETPSDQPSNANGEYIRWLSHVDSRVKPEVVTNLEGVSQQVGYQLQVTSGYRSPEYNANVGGAKKSQHMLGNATDIVQTGLTTQQRKDFIQAAIDNGFTAIGVYNTFTHIDIRGAKVAWGSNGSRTSLPNYPWALEILRANGYPY